MSTLAGTPAARRRRADGDRGFTIVWSALLLTTLMLMAAFSVDVGSWYGRATQIQRGADAAALAGVVGMPNLTLATDRALEVAAKNTFVDGVDGIDITVTSPSARRLKVCIKDNHVPAHFGRVVTDEIAIDRCATAEYTEPILLGSPQNYLGSGNLNPSWTGTVPAGANVRQHFWLSVNGYCTAKEEGDFYLSRYDGTSNETPLGCGAEALPTSSSYSEPNPDYNGAGYVYAVVAPHGRSNHIDLQFYDIAYCPDGSSASASSPIDEKLIASGSQITTYIRVRYPDTNGTPFNLQDDDLMWEGSVASGANNCPRYYRTWWSPSNADGVRGPRNNGGRPLRIKTSDAPTSPSHNNRYHIEVWTQREPNSFGFNNFAIRANIQSRSGRRCDVRGYAQCPQVSGETAMSVFADAPTSTATFYLAQIGNGYAGKAMVINLWDPGEGGQELRVFNPDTGDSNSDAWPFRWRTAPPDTLSPGWTNDYVLNVSGTGPQPGPGGTRYGTGKFNDRNVEMLIPLPSNYAASRGGWWRLRYSFGAANPNCAPTSPVCDRTTWMVRVVGDPVHLTRD